MRTGELQSKPAPTEWIRPRGFRTESGLAAVPTDSLRTHWQAQSLLEAQEEERHPTTAAPPLPVLAGLHHPTHSGGFCDAGLHLLLA